MEVLLARGLVSGDEAMQIVLKHIVEMQPGELQTFGYISDGKRGNALCRLSAMSSKSPRVHLALQYVIRNYFRISDVIPVRLGKSIAKVGIFAGVDGSILIHYTSDTSPDFHYSESDDTSYSICLLYTSPSPRDQRGSRMPSSA